MLNSSPLIAICCPVFAVGSPVLIVASCPVATKYWSVLIIASPVVIVNSCPPAVTIEPPVATTL